MKIIALTLSVLCCLFAAPGYADETLAPQLIYAIDADSAELGIKYSFENGQQLEGCSSASVFVKNSAMSERILNIALAAHYAQRPVQFRVQGCTTGSMNAIAISLPE